jgi:carbamoyltransferase
LERAGVRSVEELDLVCSYYAYPLMWNPRKYTDNRHHMNLLTRASVATVVYGMRAYNRLAGYSDERSRKAFERNAGVRLRPGQFRVVPHHINHAASSFFQSPFESALCVTLDAEGESASTVVSVARGNDIEVIDEVFSPNSFGYLYTFVTTFLGFDYWDEYKVMGLAPYGDASRYRSYFESILRRLPGGRCEVDTGLIAYLMARDAVVKRKGGGRFFPPSMTRALGPNRGPDEPITQRHMDIAASLQEALERAVLHMLTHHRERTGERNLCLAGGVALNCSMNGKIARSGLFENIWIHPAAHDAGTSAGAALYGYHHVLRGKRHPAPSRSPYLGPAHQRWSVDRALTLFDSKVVHRRPSRLIEDVAKAIANGKVVGWYQGHGEWGPRALGNRSILADPRRDDMKDIVNHAVKLREGFRPFAPACLAEHASEWFDMTGLQDSPYMLFVVPVKNDKRGKIPAVTHVDGSARVQTVTNEQNPRFWALLKAFNAITGTPIVMNTSFNVKGEPIVNTPEDAVRCFLGTQIDMLVLDDVVVEKKPAVVEAMERERAFSRRSSGRVVGGQIQMA